MNFINTSQDSYILYVFSGCQFALSLDFHLVDFINCLTLSKLCFCQIAYFCFNLDRSKGSIHSSFYNRLFLTIYVAIEDETSILTKHWLRFCISNIEYIDMSIILSKGPDYVSICEMLRRDYIYFPPLFSNVSLSSLSLKLDLLKWIY